MAAELSFVYKNMLYSFLHFSLFVCFTWVRAVRTCFQCTDWLLDLGCKNMSEWQKIVFLNSMSKQADVLSQFCSINLCEAADE